MPAVRIPERFPVRLLASAAGWVGIGLGVSLLLRSGLGVAPYDVFTSGLAHTTGIAVGTASWICAGSAVALAWILGQRPGIGTLIGAFVVGATINIALATLPGMENAALWLAALTATAGLTSLLLGASLSVAGNLGAGGIELLMLALARQGRKGKGLGIARARWLLESTVCLVGWLLGGSVGVFTLISVAVAGPALARLIPWLSRLIHQTPHLERADDGDIAAR